MPDRSWALQRKLLRAPGIGFNAELYRHFKDLDEDLPPQRRLALRNSLLIQARESRPSAMQKIQYFSQYVRKDHLKPEIIGIDIKELGTGVSVKHKPQVLMQFRQDLDVVPDGYIALQARISFRLMDRMATTITKADIQALATKIKNEFALNGGYTFDKGKVVCNYINPENGYNLQLYTTDAAEGEQVVRKVLDIQGHVFDSNNLIVNVPQKNSVNTGVKITILGESAKTARWRPTGRVRFLYATLALTNRGEPICLVDRSGIKTRAIHKIA